MKKLLIVLYCLLLFPLYACSRQTNLQSYQPIKSNDYDPVPIIKSAIELQPPTYVDLPTKVEVTNKYIKLIYLESAFKFPVSVFARREDQIETETVILYEHIGSLKLFRKDVWWVEIADPAGNYIYSIYTFNEDRAKRLIDALTVLMDSARSQ